LKTLISIHAYAGDQELVKSLMPFHEAHGLPICILSPEDSPVTFLPSVLLGRRAYIGQDSLDRQLLHLRYLLAQPYDFYLMHDSDSLCISPKIPDFIFTEDTFFSNEVVDPRPHATPGFPKLAYQPSYAMPREVLEKIVAVALSVPVDSVCPYIDNIVMRWVVSAGVKSRSFNDHNFAHPVKSVAGIERFRNAMKGIYS